ncbi:hypothetical protein CYY_000128 [Polysphondylium violaceum]|uniref:Transmembrane protein n=1 Tax=Polysphondylium violaceum TaxID=133409 RepID=A0A8J4V604_9MYCE|nr:hypothetical protein CYY_000128 [Polysphondylium violaceum]
MTQIDTDNKKDINNNNEIEAATKPFKFKKFNGPSFILLIILFCIFTISIDESYYTVTITNYDAAINDGGKPNLIFKSDYYLKYHSQTTYNSTLNAITENTAISKVYERNYNKNDSTPYFFFSSLAVFQNILFPTLGLFILCCLIRFKNQDFELAKSIGMCVAYTAYYIIYCVYIGFIFNFSCFYRHVKDCSSVISGFCVSNHGTFVGTHFIETWHRSQGSNDFIAGFIISTIYLIIFYRKAFHNHNIHPIDFMKCKIFGRKFKINAEIPKVDAQKITIKGIAIDV